MLRIATISALLVAFGSASASAEETPVESRQVQSIVRNTASPFCPGKTLDSCPSPKAGEWRRDIREWVGEGVPEPEIRDRLQARVPGFDLSIPPVKSGWVIPAVAVALSTWWFVVSMSQTNLCIRALGSSASRSPSASKLNEIKVMANRLPGKKAIHQA